MWQLYPDGAWLAFKSSKVLILSGFANSSVFWRDFCPNERDFLNYKTVLFQIEPPTLYRSLQRKPMLLYTRFNHKIVFFRVAYNFFTYLFKHNLKKSWAFLDKLVGMPPPWRYSKEKKSNILRGEGHFLTFFRGPGAALGSHPTKAITSSFFNFLY